MRRREFLRTSAVGLPATALPIGVARAEPAAQASRLRVVGTTVEYAETLLGTDVTAPRLAWTLAADGTGARQSAYEIQVGTFPELSDVWQSSRVGSDRTTGIPYGGGALRPRTRYHWRVRVWDGDNQPSEWSTSSWWETALLGASWQARWIGAAAATSEQPAPLLRKEFTLGKPVSRARLYISGLAYYETEINGSRIGDRVLDPGFTDYDNTVLYATHDVTAQVRTGSNAIGVTLGRGFYGMRTPNTWRWERPAWHDEPKLLAQLEIEHPDGTRTTIASDESWRLTSGPTLVNNLYVGETFDARRAPRDWTKPGFDDSRWQRAPIRPAARGTLKAQEHEPIRVIESITPVAITRQRAGVFVADMGRTMSGWTRLTVRASAGTVVRLKHGETLNSDGTVRMTNGHVSGSRDQVDEYICAGSGEETWEPKFSYKGFRYVEVTGLSAAPRLAGRLVHSDVPSVSTFRCSEPLFERYDAAMRRTVVNNLHGIPTDTPTYEKNGWTGDVQVGAPSMLAEFGMAKFFTKWLGDLADSQDAAGQLPVIVPSGGWGYRELAPAPEWTTVYPFLLREMYRIYGDDRLPVQHWPALTRYLDWEIGRLRDGLSVTALGDWVPPGSDGLPPEDTRLTATAYLYRALLHTAELGDVIGKPVPRYREVAANLRSVFNRTFLHPGGYYRTAKDPGYRQTSNAIPLAFGMVPSGSVQAVADRLAAEVKANGNHVNVGCLGASVLLKALTDNGHAGVAHAMATERTYPSWGYWFANGADTMWEKWDTGTRSRNHYFKGTVVQWLYEHVAGLRPGDAGYRTFTVRPDATRVSWARLEFMSVRGRISVAWTKVDGVLRLTVEVPVGSTADVHVPTQRGFTVVSVPHGTWRFDGGSSAAAATPVPAS